MSIPNATPYFQRAVNENGIIAVPKPGIVRTIGTALTAAYGRTEATPEDLADLLRRLDAITSPVTGPTGRDRD